MFNNENYLERFISRDTNLRFEHSAEPLTKYLIF